MKWRTLKSRFLLVLCIFLQFATQLATVLHRVFPDHPESGHGCEHSGIDLVGGHTHLQGHVSGRETPERDRDSSKPFFPWEWRRAGLEIPCPAGHCALCSFENQLRSILKTVQIKSGELFLNRRLPFPATMFPPVSRPVLSPLPRGPPIMI